MKPKTSRDISGSQPRKDEEREIEQAVVKDSDKTDQADRDSVHGNGRAIELGRK